VPSYTTITKTTLPKKGSIFKKKCQTRRGREAQPRFEKRRRAQVFGYKRRETEKKALTERSGGSKAAEPWDR